MDWYAHAQKLASDVCGPASRWYDAVTSIPRHLFVPHWWSRAEEGWELNDGAAHPERWLRSSYSDTSLAISIAGQHADHASLHDRPHGRPTSSSTMPSLVLQMLRYARLTEGIDVLDVGTGSGYGAALLTHRFGGERVSSVDVDPYLTTAAAGRLSLLDLHPTLVTCDATTRLPGTYDRIAATVAVRSIPQSWLAALRPGGRLVTTIANTSAIVTAEKTEDGGALGRVERDWAMFMETRHGPQYPLTQDELLNRAKHEEGDEVSEGLYPVVNVLGSWELRSMLEIEVPDIEYLHWGQAGGPQTLVMTHPDGSWARATMHQWEPPIVHQAGPQRLWDLLDRTRTMWLRLGHFPLYGAKASIFPNGTIQLRRGGWEATINCTPDQRK